MRFCEILSMYLQYDRTKCGRILIYYATTWPLLQEMYLTIYSCENTLVTQGVAPPPLDTTTQSSQPSHQSRSTESL